MITKTRIKRYTRAPKLQILKTFNCLQKSEQTINLGLHGILWSRLHGPRGHYRGTREWLRTPIKPNDRGNFFDVRIFF